ncbi:META domain-containing protein [Lacihabitans sp. LS3-19]|uniref:META domain-containing protein n=1 Tax=Lacihabitans sp. LS3-19 TaxID=2487335 RepID=UPI0020CEFE7B|nr:META domain-containing protein [Lacihabitans sp. LS3-19]MCP9767780.1 META domain-containing protein [Lacihabitans sp. LS3-19]
MAKFLFLLLFISLLKMESCTKVEVQAEIQTKIEGKWILKHKFLGDAIDTPCGYAVTNARDITLEISKDTESKEPNVYKISGNSAVNLYFGNLKINTTDAANGISTITIGQLGSTKMAGPPELMQCETGYFDLFNQSVEFRIENEHLQIGVFKKDNTPSRDGGTYLIYEKAI